MSDDAFGLIIVSGLAALFIVLMDAKPPKDDDDS